MLFPILKGKKIDEELNSIFVRYDPGLKKFCISRIRNEILASINTSHTHTEREREREREREKERERDKHTRTHTYKTVSQMRQYSLIRQLREVI